MVNNKVPTDSEWGDLSDNDVYDAFEIFHGKTKLDVQEILKRNPAINALLFGWMPLKPFHYYIFGYYNYIKNLSIENDDLAYLVYVFVSILEKKSEQNIDFIGPVYDEIYPFLLDVYANYESHYKIDLSIYEDIQFLCKKIITRMGKR